MRAMASADQHPPFPKIATWSWWRNEPRSLTGRFAGGGPRLMIRTLHRTRDGDPAFVVTADRAIALILIGSGLVLGSVAAWLHFYAPWTGTSDWYLLAGMILVGLALVLTSVVLWGSRRTIAWCSERNVFLHERRRFRVVEASCVADSPTLTIGVEWTTGWRRRMIPALELSYGTGAGDAVRRHSLILAAFPLMADCEQALENLPPEFAALLDDEHRQRASEAMARMPSKMKKMFPEDTERDIWGR